MSNTPKRKSKAGTRTTPPRSRTMSAQPVQSPWPRRFAYLSGAAVAGVILATVFLAGGDDDLPDGPPDGVEIISPPIVDRQHVAGEIDYGVPVPAGGNHNDIWQNCGFYDGEIREENALHSLEHGAVWITYRRDIGQDAIDSLRGLVRNRLQVLVSEVPTMDVPLMATAWNVQLELDSYDDTAVRRFIREFEDGAFAPEIAATCSSGGVGVPA